MALELRGVHNHQAKHFSIDGGWSYAEAEIPSFQTIGLKTNQIDRNISDRWSETNSSGSARNILP